MVVGRICEADEFLTLNGREKESWMMTMARMIIQCSSSSVVSDELACVK